MTDSNSTRQEVIDFCLRTRLIETCCECQMSKVPEEKIYLEDLIQDTWLWLMTYDEGKLLNAYEKKHLNALITSVLVKNIFSKKSPYFQRYHKDSSRCREITDKELNLPDGTGL